MQITTHSQIALEMTTIGSLRNTVKTKSMSEPAGSSSEGHAWIGAGVSQRLRTSAAPSRTHADDFVDIGAEIAQMDATPALSSVMREARSNAAVLLYGRDELHFRALRLRSGMSQEALASAMGTKQASVSKWENGMGNPTLLTIKKIAAVLGVSVEEVAASLARSRGSDLGKIER